MSNLFRALYFETNELGTGWELAVETSWVGAAFQTKAPVKKLMGLKSQDCSPNLSLRNAGRNVGALPGCLAEVNPAKVNLGKHDDKYRSGDWWVWVCRPRSD